MNKVLNIFTLVLVAGMFFISACGDDGGGGTEDPTQQEIATENLVNGNPWTLTSATGPNGDVTADYAGTAITFTETTYSISGLPAGENPWTGATSGNWDFVNTTNLDITTPITRADGLEMTANITASQLTLSFTITASGGRVNGIEGDWNFRFAATN